MMAMLPCSLLNVVVGAQEAPLSRSRAKRRRVFHSVFPTDSPLWASAPQPQSHSHHLAGNAVFHDQPGRAGSSVGTFSYTSPPTASFWPTSGPSQPNRLFTQSKGAFSAGESLGQLNGAWSLSTSVLQLLSDAPPQGQITAPSVALEFASQAHEDAFTAALQVVVGAWLSECGSNGNYDIVAWYRQQVRAHFLGRQLGHLASITSSVSSSAKDVETVQHDSSSMGSASVAVLESIVHHLEKSFLYYFSRLQPILQAIERHGRSRLVGVTADSVIAQLTSDLHALVANMSNLVKPVIQAVLEPLIEHTLQVPRAGKKQPVPGHNLPSSDDPGNGRARLLRLVETLHQVGLAGESLQLLFAEIMDRNMTDYISHSFARLWKSFSKPESGRGLDRWAVKSMHLTQPSWCIVSLCDWIENSFARLALEVLSRVDKTSINPKIVSMEDVHQWKEIGIGRLSALRISELFDIIIHWPASKGALDDLKASVATPQRRWQLTQAFSAALERRLLHPARSTLDILRVYVSMIRAFHALDHSMVLLSRVVPSLQLYLVQREDAVRIVVTGLLASPEEAEEAEKGSWRSNSDKLVELALLLDSPDQERRSEVEDDDLDWDDMNWVPDPVDAGVNYKRPRSEDVIGTLINTLGSEEVFIKEFQNIVAEHLLSNQTDFTREQRVLDLLQKRFGEAALQNCEVMIKDIYDSRKVDTHIRRVELGQPPQPPKTFGAPATPPAYMDIGKQLVLDEEANGQVPYDARILSRLYWPSIVQETFKLPQPVQQQQDKYEAGYEKLKAARKLTWLHQMGQASVELELEDRTVNVECKTFEAAVIYAFQDDGTDKNAEEGNSMPVRRTVQELQEALQMDEELVLQALEMWESQEVLARYSTSPDTYIVLERKSPLHLTRPDLHPSVSAPAALEGEHHFLGIPSKPSGVKRAGTTSAMDAKENERRAMYWQFIVGMLTNSMPMVPLGQMAMMMRMLIADGFSWSDQELEEFLAEKTEMAELELVGGKYKLPKK
ncbi:hypothetical protein BD289DRAFT_498484 [Coniella lustricola]|uniref:Anaphase-promoting complex subunit 2 n=1 Tax=Coniella lustricola TaxID=2025994 RepID=A0A2T3AAU8_9PEZI|nr:hypothetical protein BD289DRAFT_498484 [Coniella lustricola]